MEFTFDLDDLLPTKTKRKNRAYHISESQLKEFDRGIDYDKLIGEALIATYPKQTRPAVAKKLTAALGKNYKVWRG